MEHAIELRAALRGGAGPLLGFWATIPSPLTAEVAGRGRRGLRRRRPAARRRRPHRDAGHAPGDPARRRGAARARGGQRRRGPSATRSTSGRIGVIVPMVDSPEEAAQAVAACRYATEGVRSVGVLRGTSGAGAPEPPLCLVMVETRTALEAARRSRRRRGSTASTSGRRTSRSSLGLQPTAARAPAGARGHRARPGGCKAADRLCGLHCLTARGRGALRRRRLRADHDGRGSCLPADRPGLGAHAGAGPLTRGRSTRAAAPRRRRARPRRAASARARPPWASATERTIERPRPAPPRAACAPPRSNGSTSRAATPVDDRAAVDRRRAPRRRPPRACARDEAAGRVVADAVLDQVRRRAARAAAARRSRARARARAARARRPPARRRRGRRPRARGRAARPPAAGARSARAPSGPPSAIRRCSRR